MKNFIYALVTILLLVNHSNAQIDIQNVYLFSHQNDERDQRNSHEEEFIEAVKESEQFKWQNATLTLNGSSDTIVARYNSIIDAIEVKNNDKVFELLKRDNLQVNFTDSNITYIANSYYGDDGKIYTSFFIADSFSEELGVFKRIAFEKINTPKKSTFRRDNENFKIAKKHIYYMINENNQLSILTTKKKIIKRYFPDKFKSILKYIKTNKLSSKNEKDLLSLANFIKNLES